MILKLTPEMPEQAQ